ncbi:hypothetical protein QQ045_031382 [Rhodiola kirilowii]
MLVFTNGSTGSLGRLMAMFNSFCTWTGQEINADKSNIFFPSHMPEEERGMMLEVTNFTEGKFPTTYLGAPLFPMRVKIEYFQGIEDKIRSRISSWLCNMLSLGGRIILVKAVLNSMMIHLLAALPTPTTVKNHINSLLANFIWDNKLGDIWLIWRMCVLEAYVLNL